MGSHPPRQLSSTCLIGIMNHPRMSVIGAYAWIHHQQGHVMFLRLCSRRGTWLTFTISLEERNKVFNADLSNKPELEV